MFAAQGITLALLARERTGRGQRVDIGMLDATAALLTYQAGIYFATGTTPAADGKPPSDDRAVRDVRGVGWRVRDRRRQRRSVAPVLRGDRRAGARDRRAIRDQSRFALPITRCCGRCWRNAFGRVPAREWVEALQERRRPVRIGADGVAEVLADPQLAAREMIQELQHPVAGTIRAHGQSGQAVRQQRAPTQTAPPTLGQHTDPILREDVGLERGGSATLAAERDLAEKGTDLLEQQRVNVLFGQVLDRRRSRTGRSEVIIRRPRPRFTRAITSGGSCGESSSSSM